MIEFPPGVEACEARIFRNISSPVSVWTNAILPPLVLTVEV